MTVTYNRLAYKKQPASKSFCVFFAELNEMESTNDILYLSDKL